jgi:methylmalonyl-CoA mutase N-terminal domain/subunit
MARMSDDERWREHEATWTRERLEPALERAPERKGRFITQSGVEIDRVYTPADLRDPANDPDAQRPRYRFSPAAGDADGWDEVSDLGLPGEPPFTRGIHPTGHRGRLWTMRMFAGFGTAEDTNDRFKKLIAAGGTGLSIAYDMPTLYGYDHDEPMAEGEFGTCGVAVSSLADMEILLEGLPVGEISTSMTINSPAAMIWAMYITAAEKMGVPRAQLTGTLQNDILKEFIAQKEFIFPPRPSMRLVTDVFDFCAQHVPRWNTISVSGYHIREAGSTAAQELAFTLRNGVEYVQYGIDAGLGVDVFAPRISFFFNAHSDFFEEIAKFRAARRMWARLMRDRFGARQPRSWQLRFHAQTAGVSLTAQQPYNNVVRTAVQALAAVLGGTQSLHTNALDEALALPTEAAATLAVRTQQVLAHETGLTDVVDPFGGSWFVERLTDDLERDAYAYIATIDGLGGMIEAIEEGFPQREIAEASYTYQQSVERRERIVVGVNEFVADAAGRSPETLYIDEAAAEAQLKRLAQVRATRDQAQCDRALEALKAAAESRDNTMPALLDAVRAYATVGEMCDVLRKVWGEYQETPTI